MILAIANRKGGVGKTTVAVALGTRLCAKHRVLLIDLDSQASATEMLNIPLQPSVAVWLTVEKLPETVKLESGLEVLPGNVKTEMTNVGLAASGDIAAIQRGLEEARHHYDYIIMDCPPSLSLLTRAAIYAADYVLCPTVPEYLSVAGVRQLIAQVSQIRSQHERPVKLLGIQPNKYDRRTNEHRANLTDMVRAYGAYGRNNGRVWPPLRQTIAVATASAEGRPLWEVLDGHVLQEWETMVERVSQYG
jgi:chromosome partitioning protein